MILELMPSHAETYHVFLKTIACYLSAAGVPRHGAGGVHTYVCTYMVCIVCNVHVQLMEAENHQYFH